MNDADSPGNTADAWRLYELSQLRSFRSLSLREKLEAVEGMAEVVWRLQKMRREGALRPSAENAGDKRA